MPPTPSATANKKPWERACWREVGMKEPIASSLLVRTLPKSLAWPKTTSNIRAAASRISFELPQERCSKDDEMPASKNPLGDLCKSSRGQHRVHSFPTRRFAD